MDRRQEAAQARFRDGVEWVRAGTIFAQSDKQYSRWKASQKRADGPGIGLTGNALEQAVMHMRGIAGATVVDSRVSAAEWKRHQAAIAAVELVPHPATMAG